jgi:hypothetical protein
MFFSVTDNNMNPERSIEESSAVSLDDLDEGSLFIPHFNPPADRKEI